MAELQRRDAVRVTELAAVLSVSEMTIRRDIDALDTAGSLRKVHGGAMRLTEGRSMEPGFERNSGRNAAAKSAIAGAAAALIRPGMTIAVTGGTTTYQLAQLLGPASDLTVVTNSLKVADALYRYQAGQAEQAGPLGQSTHAVEAGQTETLAPASTQPQRPSPSPSPSATVIITGGERTLSEALVGPVATAAIRSLHVDLCFMGTHGVDLEYGLTSPNLQEAETNRAFAAAAGTLVVLADADKFGVVALAGVVDLDRVSILVTDREPTHPGYRERVAQLLVTGAAASSSGKTA